MKFEAEIGEPVKTRPCLPLLLVLLLLGACGEQGSSGTSAEEAATPSDTLTVLPARDGPLGQGDVAPPFSGLPEGKTVVVFYRGPW